MIQTHSYAVGIRLAVTGKARSEADGEFAELELIKSEAACLISPSNPALFSNHKTMLPKLCLQHTLRCLTRVSWYWSIIRQIEAAQVKNGAVSGGDRQ